MPRQFDVVVEKDSEGYFVATVPALPGCHMQAKSLDELMSRIREAIELCLEVQGSPAEPLDFVGVQRVQARAGPRFIPTRARILFRPSWANARLCFGSKGDIPSYVSASVATRT